MCVIRQLHIATTSALSSESDVEPGDTASGALPSTSSYAWVQVTNTYVSQMNFNFTSTAGLDSSVDLTADSMPIEFVNLFITDEIIDNLVAEANRPGSRRR